MVKQLHFISMFLLLLMLMGGSVLTVSADPVTLFHESFGDNSGSARDWNDSYSVKSGVSAVYSGITSYTVTNAKQGKNTTGSTKSGLNQSTAGTDASIIIGPLNVDSYNTLTLTYKWKAASIKETYSTQAYYATSSTGDYFELTGTGAGATTFVERSYSLPAAAQVSTLYIKIVWNTSNTQAIIDEVDLSGVLPSDPSSAASFTEDSPTINYPTTKTYSQAPTTADGYSGTISYSMTSNTAGATINSETGVVTVTQGGSVTVKAIASAVLGSFTASEATYILTVNDTRAELGDKLAWSAASATVTYGADDNIFPTLTNTQGVDVTYESSDVTAATIDENTGMITLKDVISNKQTTIRAIFAGNDDYLAKTVEYTLNVNKAPFAIKDGVFDFVGAAGTEDYGSGMTLVSDGYTTDSKTWTAGNVTMVTSKDSGNGYRWWKADGTLRFYNGSIATFTVPGGYVITKIVTTGANFDTASLGTLSGSTWIGASNEVALTATATRNIKTITVTYMLESQSATVQSYGWATYITPAAVSFAAGDAYVVSAENGTNATVTEISEAPTNTPVLLKGAGTKTITVVASASAPAPNLLTVSNGAESGTIWVLAKEGEGAQFKQWTGDVASLKDRVILVGSSSARSLNIVIDETSSIHNAQGNMHNEAGAVYNLNGQRVSKAQKGLYIVNGKKVIKN